MNETLYGLDIDELKHRRFLLLEMIRKYKRKHYDPRIILPEYRKITNWLNKHGCNFTDLDYCHDEYWNNPLKYDRQHLNQNPIIDIQQGLLIRNKQKERKIVQPSIQEPSKKYIETSKNDSNKSYYKINISWTESDNKAPNLDKVIKFFNELGLDRIEKDNWEMSSNITEYQISYKFEGTDDGFLMLKRSAMVLLDILNENNNFEIAIHGKKIT